MKNERKIRRVKKLKSDQLAEICAQIAALAGVGIHIGTAMEILQKGMTDSRLSAVYKELHQLLMDGVLFSDAMEQTGAFPEMMIRMFQSAEATGQMEKTAHRLSVHYQKYHQLKSQIYEALLYPKILLLTSIFMFLFVFWFVIPEIYVLFDNSELPVWTRCLATASSIVKEFWYMIILSAVLLPMAGSRLLKMKKVRIAWDRCKIYMPMMGKCRTTIYTACFVRAFSSLYGSGFSLIGSLELSSKTVGNLYLEDQWMEAVMRIRDGTLLSDVIGRMKGLDRKLAPMIYVGEETGKLDTMLDRIADNYEHEAEMILKRMAAMAEPVMILIMGFLIGSVLFGIMLPIWNMYGTI